LQTYKFFSYCIKKTIFHHCHDVIWEFWLEAISRYCLSPNTGKSYSVINFHDEDAPQLVLILLPYQSSAQSHYTPLQFVFRQAPVTSMSFVKQTQQVRFCPSLSWIRSKTLQLITQLTQCKICSGYATACTTSASINYIGQLRVCGRIG